MWSEPSGSIEVGDRHVTPTFQGCPGTMELVTFFFDVRTLCGSSSNQTSLLSLSYRSPPTSLPDYTASFTELNIL